MEMPKLKDILEYTDDIVIKTIPKCRKRPVFISEELELTGEEEVRDIYVEDKELIVII